MKVTIMLKIKFIVLFISSLITFDLSYAREMPDFQIKAGLMRANGEGDFYVYKETTDIPLVTSSQDPNYYFGVSVRPLMRKIQFFPCKAIIKVPTPDEILKANAHPMESVKSLSIPSPQEKKENPYTTFKSKEGICLGAFIVKSQFNAGDKQGKYSFELIINDKPLGTINFNVVKP